MHPPEDIYTKAMLPETLAEISGRELLIQHLGYWPKFTDFEVLSIVLERALVKGTMSDLRAVFWIFDIYKDPNDLERKQGSAELIFEDVDSLCIRGFGRQNPIEGLSIAPAEPPVEGRRFQVQWVGTCIQHEVSFTCSRISVLRVIDLNPFRKPHLILP